MSKQMKSHNRNCKAIIKNQKRTKLYHEQSSKNQSKEKRSKGEYTYLALDSCTIIDMVKMLNTSSNKWPVSQRKYFSNLRAILQRSVYSSDGSRNPSGRYVFCLLPSVMKEMSDENGIFHKTVRDFIENRMLVISINKDYEKYFKRKTEKLAKAYAEKGHFIDKDGMPSMDGYITAESAIFNITLISRDNHIVKDLSNPKLSEKRTQQVKTINQRLLNTEFHAEQSEMLRAGTFMQQISKGQTLPKPNNFAVMDNQTQTILFKEFKYRPPKRTAAADLIFG